MKPELLEHWNNFIESQTGYTVHLVDKIIRGTLLLDDVFNLGLTLAMILFGFFFGRWCWNRPNKFIRLSSAVLLLLLLFHFLSFENHLLVMFFIGAMYPCLRTLFNESQRISQERYETLQSTRSERRRKLRFQVEQRKKKRKKRREQLLKVKRDRMEEKEREKAEALRLQEEAEAEKRRQERARIQREKDAIRRREEEKKMDDWEARIKSVRERV